MKTLITKTLQVIAFLTLNIILSLEMVLGQEPGYTEYLRVNSMAGKLDSLIETSNYQIRKIAISGSINAKDFRFIKTFLKNIEDIDLSEVSIEEYIGSEGTNEGYNYKYPANEIPLGAFFYWVPVDNGMHSIKNVKLPKTVTAIRRNAFARNYNLQSIDIPEGVTTVDYVAFTVDTSLISIQFPSTLKTIGSLAFHNCINLDTVVLAAKTPPAMPLDAFESGGNNRKPYSATLYIPIGTKSQYLNSNWKVFKNIVEKDFSTQTGEIPKEGLVAYYPFNGNANDESGNANHGIVNGASLTSDRFGNDNSAYEFDGTNSHILVNDTSLLDLTNNFSISSWFEADATIGIPGSVKMILSKHRAGESEGYVYGLWGYPFSNPLIGIVNFASNPYYTADTYPDQTLGKVQSDKWYHFVTTYNKSTSTLKYYGIGRAHV